MRKKATNKADLLLAYPPAPVAPSQQATLRLRIIKGPHKGASYKLIGKKITIGRSSRNDIILEKDKKCSREQALILLESTPPVIKDVSQRSSLRLNNKTCASSHLKHGDKIQFGNSVLQLEAAKNEKKKNTAENQALAPLAAAQPVPAPLAGIPNSPANQYDPFPQTRGGSPPTAARRHRRQKSSFFPRLLLFGMIFGALYLYLSDSPPIKKDADKLQTLEEKRFNVESLSKLREKEIEQRTRNLSVNFQNAQAAYIKGIRDYRKGIYIRAIEAFRVCQTLYPQHELCTAYLKKARIKREQLIQAWMVAGKNFRQKRRFKACMSSFKNVLQAIRNKENLTYREALENYNICKIQHEVRY